jgi:hypothetical protein
MQHDNQSIHLSCPSTSSLGSLGHGNVSDRIDNAIQVLVIMVSSLPFHALHVDTFFSRRITWNRDSFISQALILSLLGEPFVPPPRVFKPQTFRLFLSRLQRGPPFPFASL